MALNNYDRSRVVSIAKSKGYTVNSDGTGMTNRNGGWMKFSSCGQSVKINGSSYNDVGGAKKSSRW